MNRSSRGILAPLIVMLLLPGVVVAHETVRTSVARGDGLDGSQEPSGPGALSVGTDTLMVGCDLYLLGRHVEPEARGGQVGYRVTRTADAVFINDIEYFNVRMKGRSLPDSLVPAETRATAARIDLVAKEVRALGRPPESGRVQCAGSDREIGQEFAYLVDDAGVPLNVTLYDDHFLIRYSELKVSFGYAADRPEEAPSDAARVNQVYWNVVSALGRGGLVLMGRGYIERYSDPNDQENVRRVISLIPTLAKPRPYRDRFGDSIYEMEPLYGIHLLPSTVTEFVTANDEVPEESRPSDLRATFIGDCDVEAMYPINSRDLLVWSHLVVRGIVTSVTEPSLPIREWLPASQTKTGDVTVGRIRVRVLEVLKGDYSSEVLNVWKEDEYGDGVRAGDSVVVCADFAPYILTGTYYVGSVSSFYREEGGYWTRPAASEVMRSLPDGGSNASPMSHAWSPLTLTQIHERVAQASPRSVARNAEIAAIGTVSSVEDSTTIPPFIVKVTMDVQSVLKGKAVDHVTFFVGRGHSSFDPNVVILEVPSVGQQWFVFLRRRDGILYPFAGPNGLMRIDGSKLIVDGVVAHKLSVRELEAVVEETVR